MPMTSRDFDLLEKQIRDAHEAMSIHLSEKYEEAMRVLDGFRKMFGAERPGKKFHIPALKNFEQVSNAEVFNRIVKVLVDLDNSPQTYDALVSMCKMPLDRVHTALGVHFPRFKIEYQTGVGAMVSLNSWWYEELKAHTFLSELYCQGGNTSLQSSRLTSQSATPEASKEGDIDETRCPEGANTASTEASTVQRNSETP